MANSKSLAIRKRGNFSSEDAFVAFDIRDPMPPKTHNRMLLGGYTSPSFLLWPSCFLICYSRAAEGSTVALTWCFCSHKLTKSLSPELIWMTVQTTFVPLLSQIGEYRNVNCFGKNYYMPRVPSENIGDLTPSLPSLVYT